MSTLRVQVLIRLLLRGLSKCVTEKTCLLQINGTSIKYILRLNSANTENTAPRWIAGDMVCIPNAFNITKGDKNTLKKKKKKKFIFSVPFTPPTYALFQRAQSSDTSVTGRPSWLRCRKKKKAEFASGLGLSQHRKNHTHTNSQRALQGAHKTGHKKKEKKEKEMDCVCAWAGHRISS